MGLENINNLFSSKSYPEQVEFQKLDFIVDEIFSLSEQRKVFILCDSNIFALYKEIKVLDSEKIYLYKFNSSEKAKSLKTAQKVWDILLKLNFNRNDFFVVIGGGISLDIAGFIASSYKRGINLLKIPTSLLAMVDACIGGKTAINYRSYKNMIGSFYFASRILIDINFLKTLDDKEYFNGLAELLKYGFIGEEEIFKSSQNYYKKILSRDFNLISSLIKKAVFYKINLIKDDLFDTKNKRIFLNFGHTIAHIVESKSKYKISHGYAVAKGMAFSINLSNYLGYLPKTDKEIFLNILNNFNYNLSLNFRLKDVSSVLQKDKKIENNKISCILLDSMAKPFVKDLEIKDLEKIFSDLC